jgi:hypothetical protein
MDTNLILIGVVILVLLAAAVWLQMRRRWNRKRWRGDRARVRPHGRRIQPAESRSRTQGSPAPRGTTPHAPLAPAEAGRFAEQWRVLQGRFVGNLKEVLADADLLVRELMQSAATRWAISIAVQRTFRDHPAVVDHYAAHDIAAQPYGDVDTA